MKENEILSTVEKHAIKLADLIGIAHPHCEISLTDQNERVVNVAFEGENMGFMIGPRGRHLQSMQFVLSMMVKKELGEDNQVMVIVDAGGYAAKRIEQIEQMAEKKADDARVLGSAIDLEPMSSFERRVVHTCLAKFDDLTTESFGEGPDRFVRISIKTDNEIGIKSESKSEESEDEVEE